MELVFEHTNGRMEPRTDGWTDKRGSRNSYLDKPKVVDFCVLLYFTKKAVLLYFTYFSVKYQDFNYITTCI